MYKRQVYWLCFHADLHGDCNSLRGLKRYRASVGRYVAHAVYGNFLKHSESFAGDPSPGDPGEGKCAFRFTGHRRDVYKRQAKSWEFDEDTCTYTFHLEEGVKWHDGEDFTANDVKFTIEAIMDPDNGSENAPNYEDVEEIDVIDDYTISFKLDAPNVAFLDYMTMAVPVSYTHLDVYKRQQYDRGGEWLRPHLHCHGGLWSDRKK